MFVLFKRIITNESCLPIKFSAVVPALRTDASFPGGGHLDHSSPEDLGLTRLSKCKPCCGAGAQGSLGGHHAPAQSKPPSPRRGRGHQGSLCPESHLQLPGTRPPAFSGALSSSCHLSPLGQGWQWLGRQRLWVPLCPLSEAQSCPAPVVLLRLCPGQRHIPTCHPQPSSEPALTCGCGRDSVAGSWSRFHLWSLCAAPRAERAWKFTKFFSTKSPQLPRPLGAYPSPFPPPKHTHFL